MMLGVSIELRKLGEERGGEGTFLYVTNQRYLKALKGVNNSLGEFSPKLGHCAKAQRSNRIRRGEIKVEVY